MAFMKGRPLGGPQMHDWLKRNGSVSTLVQGTDATSVWGSYGSGSMPQSQRSAVGAYSAAVGALPSGSKAAPLYHAHTTFPAHHLTTNTSNDSGSSIMTPAATRPTSNGYPVAQPVSPVVQSGHGSKAYTSLTSHMSATPAFQKTYVNGNVVAAGITSSTEKRKRPIESESEED